MEELDTIIVVIVMRKYVFKGGNLIMEIHIPLYSIYRTKDPNRYQEILKEDSEFYLVREKSGEIIIKRNSDSEDYFDILISDGFEERPNAPLLIGQISKREIISFFSTIASRPYFIFSFEEMNEVLRKCQK